MKVNDQKNFVFKCQQAISLVKTKKKTNVQ